MPGNLLSVDTSFPTFTPEQTNEQKLDVVTNYLYMLLEQLRYTLANLGAGNFNETELDEIGMKITQPIYVDLENAAGAIADLTLTADQLTSRLEDAEGNISSIEQYARSITLSVSNGETSSTIKLLAGGVQIASQIIKMDGLVTFTGLEEGTTVINGGCIQTGLINAQYLNLTGSITFSDLSSSVQQDISDALDTANDAYELASGITLPSYIKNTYIDSARIESPTIIAGEFYGNEFNVYPQNGGDGSFNLYGDTEKASGYHMLEISYYWGTGAFVTFDSPAGAIAQWDFGTTRFRGTTVDFSDVNVTGLTGGVSDTLEGAYCDILADYDVWIESGNGDIALSCNGGDLRLSASDGQIRFFVDGTIWYLDSAGLHQ